MSAEAKRISAPSGNRDHDHFQASCDACGWQSRALHSNRTVEGQRLAKRDADQHVCRMTDLCEWFALCANPATTTEPHPILGDVPICDRCQAKAQS